MVSLTRNNNRFFQALVGALLLATVLSARAGRPVLQDPSIPDGEILVYRLIKKDGQVEESRQWVTHDVWQGEAVYVVQTASKRMLLRRADLTPLLIEKFTSTGTLEWRVEYGPDRVRFIYPGPKRNKVEKVDENRYDVNPIVHIVRGFPFGHKERVSFKLVTPERIVGVYLKVVGQERVQVPSGTFDCYKLEGGLTGLAGRLYTKKIYFWVEKSAPHRLVRQVDEGITDVRTVELIAYSVNREASPE